MSDDDESDEECPVCHGKNGQHRQITNGSEWLPCPNG